MQSTNSSRAGLLWWECLYDDDYECPITLEPIRELPYPPFDLAADASSAAAEGGRGESFSSSAPSKLSSSEPNRKNGRPQYFDGLALANFIVSRGIFQNPLTREPLTFDDCRRLDEYVNLYSPIHSSSPSSSSSLTGEEKGRRGSVLEAFGLHERMRVRVISDRTDGPPNARLRQERRAQVLRNDATAALCGLFVYNERRRERRHHVDDDDDEDDDDGGEDSKRGTPSKKQPLPRFGFHLNQEKPTQSAVQEMEGLAIIDDDEQIAVESDKQAWEQLQEDFPHLPAACTPPGHSNASKNADKANPLGESMGYPSSNAKATTVDEEFFNTVRATAERLEREEEERRRRTETSQNRLIQEKIKRREQKKREIELQRQQAREEHNQRMEEEEEIRRARAEIERWREQHWETMRLVAKAEENARRKIEETKRQEMEERAETDMDPEGEMKTGEDDFADHQRLREEQMEAQRKARAAAKKKRARERKKIQKSIERQKAEEQQQREALEEQKRESSRKCSFCGDGILDLGFEKGGRRFCSPKCARAGNPSPASVR